MKIVTIDGENLHILSSKQLEEFHWNCSRCGNIWLMIILKVTKKQGFTSSLPLRVKEILKGWTKFSTKSSWNEKNLKIGS